MTKIEKCSSLFYIILFYPIFQTVHELYDRQQYTHYLGRYLSENNHTKISTVNTVTQHAHDREQHTQMVHVSTETQHLCILRGLSPQANYTD
jgi:hypothetical protein